MVRREELCVPRKRSDQRHAIRCRGPRPNHGRRVSRQPLHPLDRIDHGRNVAKGPRRQQARGEKQSVGTQPMAVECLSVIAGSY